MDVLTAMLDGGLPLTAHERDELGDPAADAADCAALAALCPYHTLGSAGRAAYPPTLVTTAADDARVPAWGPAKFAARLRRLAAGARGPVLLDAAAHGGHFGGARGADEAAAELAFLLGALGSDEGRAAGWVRQA